MPDRPYGTSRPAHEQRLSLVDRRPPPHVEGVQFIAHLAGPVKFDRHGSLLVSLIVPKEFAELGLAVRFLDGVPLSVDVQKWRAADPAPAVDHPSSPTFARENNGGG